MATFFKQDNILCTLLERVSEEKQASKELIMQLGRKQARKEGGKKVTI